MAFWLDNPAHPLEWRPVFTDYPLNYAMQVPSYYLRNYDQVLEIALRPAIERIWNNEISAAAALHEAVKVAGPLMAGRWDR
jgi:hypothetical protein